MISNLINRKIFTLLKVQYSNMLEYRVEIALWAISGIIPFFMLNIWTNNNLNESINISDVMLSLSRNIDMQLLIGLKIESRRIR